MLDVQVFTAAILNDELNVMIIDAKNRSKAIHNF